MIPESIVGFDCGGDSALARYSSLPSKPIRTVLFKAIEKKWISEARRAEMISHLVNREDLVIIEDAPGHWQSFATARGFERSQCKWYGALRLLGHLPVYVNVSIWHSVLHISDIVRTIAAERESAGLSEMPRSEKVKSAVARFLLDQLGHVAPSHNEADALAMTIAIHRGLLTGELAVGGKNERPEIVRTAASEHRSRKGSPRKRAPGQRVLLLRTPAR